MTYLRLSMIAAVATAPDPSVKAHDGAACAELAPEPSPGAEGGMRSLPAPGIGPQIPSSAEVTS